MGGVQGDPKVREAGIETGHTLTLHKSLLLHVDVLNQHQMWEYFLLDYMASVFFSGPSTSLKEKQTGSLKNGAESFGIPNTILSHGT